MNNVLVIGANGKVGRLVVKYLAKKGKKVTAMIRSDDQGAFMSSIGAETCIGDLEKDFSHAFKDVECVVFTAGSGSHTGPDKTLSVDQEGAIKSIDLAMRFSVEKYIMVSAQGAKAPDEPSKIQHYYRAKNIADKHLIHSGLNYTIFRPGRLLDDSENRLIRISECFNDRGTTRRESLALAIVMSIDMPNTNNKILEILDGDNDIQKVLSAIK